MSRSPILPVRPSSPSSRGALGAAAAVALASLLAVPPIATAEETGATDLADRVTTLELDRPLAARGALGEIAVDRLGFLYVASFHDAVWKISPEGEVETVSRALYGASGNAVDSRGDLYQANFHADTISRIRRTGEVETFVDEGLEGPVGIVVDDEDRLYVCNCRGNRLSRVSPEGDVESLAESDLFACPNGLAFGPGGDLFVTNYNHHDILRVTMDGEVEPFATVPGGAGNAHVVFSKGYFYVTKIVAHRVVRVSPSGEVFPLAGSGAPGHDDGTALEATFHAPNGIAVSPRGDVLYVNEVVGERGGSEPTTISIRRIELVTLAGVLESALEEGGIEAAEAAYERYRAHPVRGREDTVGEMVALGYRLLSGREIPQALAIFGLNAEGNPESAAAQYHLGEAYRYTGRTAEAVERYRRVLELEPDHAQAGAWLEQLGAE